MQVRLLLLFISIFTINQIFSQIITIDKGNGISMPITTAVPFLRITPDARSSGMGDIGVCTYADANSGYHNPAKYSFLKSDYGGTFNFSPWLKQIADDIFLFNINGYYKISPNHAFGGGIRYFTLGEINLTDRNGGYLSTSKPNEYTLEGHYSARLAEFFSLGISLRYIYTNLSVNTQDNFTPASSTFSSDLGAFYERKFEDLIPDIQGTTIRGGINFSNIGGKMQYGIQNKKNYIPTNLSIGAGIEAEIDEVNKFSFNLQADKLLVPSTNLYFNEDSNKYYLDPEYYDHSSIDGILTSFTDNIEGPSGELKEIIAKVGVEYTYNNMLALRTGFLFEPEAAGGRNYISAGAGFKYNKLNIDFSYYVPIKQQRSPLDNQIKFSLSFDLDEENSKNNSTW